MAIYTGSNKHLGGTETVAREQQFFYGLIQKNVLVTGADGQLGQQLQQWSKKINTPFRFIFTNAPVLDITSADQVQCFVSENAIEYIINCAAYTHVDKAEADAKTAYEVNSLGAENLAKSGAKIIHISTDYVFDGTANVPYAPDAPTRPLSVYGASKLAGEEAVRKFANEWIIIRTSWLFSEFGNNFVKTMFHLMSERTQIGIVADQHGTPTYAADLAEMILVILESDEWKQGIYHFSNNGETTWYGFAQQIKKLTRIETCTVKPIATQEYPTAAARPMYSVLDKSKTESAFHVVIPQWEEALERCLNKLKK